ncbi:DUF6284 family protein [Streptomyces buecherae]|uniref:DUF6284 family protein n=1 Tax=Streptomyces buecherae TaxID=2763006 RepID=UPI001C27231C|nr:DUF6284 family protein [Streptomyces buecherae]
MTHFDTLPSGEPPRRALAAIRRELPVILAEVALLDAQISLLDQPLNDLTARRLRDAEREVARARLAVAERGQDARWAA